MENQSKQLLSHMRSGKSISPLQALRDYGIYRLAARIYDLRAFGYEIESKLVKRNGKRYAIYWLEGSK